MYSPTPRMVLSPNQLARMKTGEATRSANTTLMSIPNGSRGTRTTLKLMRKMIDGAKKSWDIRELALSIVADVMGKDYSGEVAAVQQWVRRNIRYVRDVKDVETLHTPQKILQIRQGDCDDHAMLVAALLESIGFTTRLHAIGFRPNKFAHVFTDAKITLKGAPQWVSVETTEDWPLGKVPRNAVSHMFVY